MPVYDAHAHLSFAPDSVEKLLGAMDEAEIDKTIVVGGGLISVETLSARLTSPDTAIGVSDQRFDNDRLRQDCERGKGRLFPFFFCNPSVDLEHYTATGGAFYGVKLAPVVHGFDYRHPMLSRLAETAAAFGHPIYTHCLPRPDVDVAAFAMWAKKHPRTTFILGHAGIHPLDLDAIETISTTDNVILETSGGYRFTIEHAVKRLGAERVAFGSEYPLQDPAVELIKIKRLRVSSRELDLIAGGTIQRCVEGL